MHMSYNHRQNSYETDGKELEVVREEQDSGEIVQEDLE
jgi:hypothetical protein